MNVHPVHSTTAASEQNASTGFRDTPASVRPDIKETDAPDVKLPKSEPDVKRISIAPTTPSAVRTVRAGAGPDLRRTELSAWTWTSANGRRTSAVRRPLAPTRSEASNVGANLRWLAILRKSLARTPAPTSTVESIQSVRSKGSKPSAFATKDGLIIPKRFRLDVSVSWSVTYDLDLILWSNKPSKF